MPIAAAAGGSGVQEGEETAGHGGGKPEAGLRIEPTHLQEGKVLPRPTRGKREKKRALTTGKGLTELVPGEGQPPRCTALGRKIGEKNQVPLESGR